MTLPVLAELIERSTGLALDRGGVNAALDRYVTERMRELKLTHIDDYVRLAADANGAEHRRLIDSITVPHTWFFRDPEQLQTIANLLTAAPPGPLAVWVAGCASGEEAYTLAMIGHRIGRELSVHATDINETALAAARRGAYGQLAVRDVPKPDQQRWFEERNGNLVVGPALRTNVTFTRHNLVDPAPVAPHGAWDLVVCRNVLIYFAPLAASRLLQRFARVVRDGGALVVGASEVVFDPPPGLELVSSGNRLVLRRPRSGSISKPPPFRRDPTGRITGTLPRFPAITSAALPPVQLPPPQLTPPQVTPPQLTPPQLTPPQLTPPQLTPPQLPAIRGGDLVAGLARGHALFERGELAAALVIYDELARAHRDVAEVWLFLGIARYAHGQLSAAADALRSSLCLAPKLWPAGFYLARAYERLGLTADARQQYDLLAVDRLEPLALQSRSAVINELRALSHDFRNAARRLTTTRSGPVRPFFK